jgi:translation initiation factor IF-3
MPERRERVNEQIRFPEVFVISETGEQMGVMHPRDAIDIARERGLDLVEVAPEARPPVCKILDYGKMRYEKSKRTTPKAKNEIKTITLRPKTGEHDLQTKLTHARKFLARGDKVRFQVRLRGRERARIDLWCANLEKVMERLMDVAVVTQHPRHEGRAIFALCEPLKKTAPTKSKDKEGAASAAPVDPPTEPAKSD